MEEFKDIQFISKVYEESKFKPKFYVVFLIAFSMYYFFSQIVSHFVLVALRNNLNISQFGFLYKLFEKFFVPNASIYLILVLYVLLIEERRLKFLFLGFKDNFLSFTLKGIVLSSFLLFSLIIVLIFKDYVISFKLNTELVFASVIQLLMILVFTYIKFFFLESFYRGWIFNILNSRYSVISAVVIASFVPFVIKFIENQRIGVYLIYAFLFNIFLTLLFLVYKNIFIVVMFSAFYDFLKKYILSLEGMSVDIQPVFYTVINNKEVYNIENSFYSILVISLGILLVYILYQCKPK